MTEGISRLFFRDGRLRSGWRVGLYLILYIVGLLIVQLPIVILYVSFLMLQGMTELSDVLAAMQPDRLPLWVYLLLKVAELVMLLSLTYAFRRLLDRRRGARAGPPALGRGWMARRRWRRLAG